jgi:dehydrodolichyl diphosphate syntase complex subunit NUS1
MSVVPAVALHFLHYLYTFITLLDSIRRRFKSPPHSLLAHRRKIPQHLAVLLIADPAENSQDTVDTLLQSVKNVAAYCRAISIPRMSVYDRQGDFSSKQSVLDC